MVKPEEPALGRSARVLPEDGSLGGPRQVFTGEQDFFLWKRAMQVQLAAEGGTPVDKAKWLIKRIGGSAVDACLDGINLESETFQFSGPNDIFSRLGGIYGGLTEATRQDAMRELARLRQGNKSFDEYLVDFNRLANQAQLQSPSRVAMMMAGISSRLAPYAGSAHYEDYAGFVQLMRRTDAMMPRERKGPTPAANQGRQRGRAAREGKPIKCWNCDTEGHTKRECPQPLKTKSRKGKENEDSEPEGESENLYGDA